MRMNEGLGLSRAAVLGAGLLLPLWLACPGMAADTAVVAGINGTPTLYRDSKPQALHPGEPVRIGDVVSTDRESKVKLLLADDSVLSIGPGTQIAIDELTLGPEQRRGRLSVLVGRFKLAIAAWLTGPSDYEVRTPTAVAGVRGTVLWGDTQLDAICSLQGTVEVRTVRGDATAKLEPGHCVTHMAEGETTPLVPSHEELLRYLREVSLD